MLVHYLKPFPAPINLPAACINGNFKLLPGFLFSDTRPDWVDWECCRFNCLHPCWGQLLFFVSMITRGVWCCPFMFGIHLPHQLDSKITLWSCLLVAIVNHVLFDLIGRSKVIVFKMFLEVNPISDTLCIAITWAFHNSMVSSWGVQIGMGWIVCMWYRGIINLGMTWGSRKQLAMWNGRRVHWLRREISVSGWQTVRVNRRWIRGI